MKSERTWPANMGFLSNQTFDYVYENNKPYVAFCRKHMTKATGVYKMWMQFLNQKK